MEFLLPAAVILFVLLLALALTVYFAARYFFRFTILRKPTATAENTNLSANTNFKQHLPFIMERKAFLTEDMKEDVYIKSFDNLRLHGTLIESKGSDKLVICFHGYSSKGLNEYGAMAKFYFEQGLSLLIVDERNHGDSEGIYTGFGVLDRLDAEKWIGYAVERFGEGVRIFLHGDSMGGATVLMTTGLSLPHNVKGVIADCAFTSAYDVFSHILKRDYHIPKFPIMNITEWMTRKKAGYGYKDVSTLDCVSKTNIPILFIHGDKDDFVPLWMSEKNFEVCSSPKKLLIIKGADHAESYYVDTESYEAAVKEMIDTYMN